jgi:threonine aldolase
VAEFAHERHLKVHLDGARLWNAAVATGVAERDYAAAVDSLSVCFSKGLGAPVGSALVGDESFIQRSRRFRKMYGGGMRQAGLLAAAALYALDQHRERLREDHANARRLAEGLADVPGLRVDLNELETNILMIRTDTPIASALAARWEAAGVRVLALGPHFLRAVTHLHINEAAVDEALRKIRALDVD